MPIMTFLIFIVFSFYCIHVLVLDIYNTAAIFKEKSSEFFSIIIFFPLYYFAFSALELICV